MEELYKLLKEGVKYEDEFITSYLKLVTDDGFMEFFGDKQEEAEKTLRQLIRESGGHKETLEEIINNL